ncbi:hypothetical protein AVEN_91208-1 [Araneus ventricosus]|uniref:DUF4817 domain-containing protein n=1 Tax=Araneus ventricosus TaxID=182803 RepID=A0A4Y2A6A9_ARAVE|nr:hypothetical protein AVEN_102515-1 [Araneus ventricosus]GBL75263.1 hypothetical protein AVEN_91208-1 [Araneus ventricosus]
MNKYSTAVRVFFVLERAKCHENVKAVQRAWQEEFHKKNWAELKIAVTTAVETIDREVCSRVMDGLQNHLIVVLIKDGGNFESHYH